MRRGRPWRGAPRGPFRGGAPGFNPRGFLSSVPPPRLNRPPWPRPVHPQLRPFGPNISDTAEKFDVSQPRDGFNEHSYQQSPHKGFQHGPGKRFQPGQHYKFDKRQNFSHDKLPGPFNSAGPSTDFHKGPSKYQGSVWKQGNAHSIFQQVTVERNAKTFNQSVPDQGEQGLLDFNQGRREFEPEQSEDENRTDFLKSRLKFNKVRESKAFADSPNFEHESTNSRHSSYRNQNFRGDQNESDLDYQTQSANFHSSHRPDVSQRPSNFTENLHNFNSKPDYSKPPPFFHQRHGSQDLNLDRYQYDERDVQNSQTGNIKPQSRGLLPTPDSSGQRPPATDHYIESNAIDGSFKKSVGDTVDIIKKRLQDRQENPTSQQVDVCTGSEKWRDHKSPLIREKTHKRSTRKESAQHKSRNEKKCERIKKKIVREMFKMDKNTLHKFVDDPQSSAKFEYAINSLITESRNSLNRQIRSAAEKSLCGSSGIPALCDKNDVYEDTFMAQMHGILDQRDIVMFSDIKPMVMAEINKVLELDEYGHRASYSEDDEKIHAKVTKRERNDSIGAYISDPFEVDSINDASIQLDDNSNEEGLYLINQDEPLPSSLTSERNKKRIDSHNSRSKEAKFSDDETGPKFPYNLDSVSDDEYTFAELDKQYHVAVVNMNDPAEHPSNAQEIRSQNSLEKLCDDKPVKMNPVLTVKSEAISHSGPRSTNVLDSMLDYDKNLVSTVAPIPLKIDLQTNCENKINTCDKRSGKESNPVIKKTESKDHLDEGRKKHKNKVLIKKELEINKNEDKNYPESSSTVKITSQDKKSKLLSSSVSKNLIVRKREKDGKTLHRQEKRVSRENLKPEPKKSEANKKVLNKNIIINVNDCASKSSETCEPGAKSVFNLFFSKPNDDDLREDTKHADSVNFSYSDRYVKRKHSPDKSENDHKKTERKKSISTSPVDSHKPTKNSSTSSLQSSKSAGKVKLQPINMFKNTPRKSAPHLARRNTAIMSPECDSQASKSVEPMDNSVTSSQPIVTKKNNAAKVTKITQDFTSSSTQTYVHVISRLTQTMDKSVNKMVSKGCQTNFLPDDKLKKHSSVKPEDVMERMKQIDLEIQQLLQEKFKLYNNIEGLDPIDNDMQSLGMAVVNMTPNLGVENTDESGILETFANMSEDELQEIASQGIPDASINIETVEIEEVSIKKVKKRPKKSTPHSPSKKTPLDSSIKKKKKKNPPKIVIKLNKNCPDGSDSYDGYKVVMSPKKQKKVIFSDPILASPKESRNRKTHKAAISLIDQVMDDHELDVMRGQDDYVRKPQKCTNLNKISKHPKKFTRKEIERLKKTVRDCSIVVTKEIFSHSLLSKLALTIFDSIEEADTATNKSLEWSQTSKEENSESRELTSPELLQEVEIVESHTEVMNIGDMQEDSEIPGFSGIQLHDDMLDVSEDIVIDGNFDIDKTVESFVERETVAECDVGPISHKDTLSSDVPKDSCKLYDFSASSELGADMIEVAGHGDAVVAMECVNGNFLAASIDGNVYYYDGRDGHLLATLRGSNFPLTCLTVVEDKHGTTVYTGSLDSRIRYYDLYTGMEKGPECNVLSPIQSMDRAWGTIFIGTRTGFVLQFECKNNIIIPVSSVRFSDQTILALRAIKEGPRKVLLVASRSDQVTIKDAQTGLLLRTLEGPKMTVYCLLFEDGKVFCGTSAHQIQVFDFTSGTNVGTHNGGKGVVCLRAAGGLLLAGCYDGCVYVYRARAPEPIAQLRGPSNLLLSLAVVHSSIVASYKDRSVFMWKIPINILSEMVL